MDVERYRRERATARAAAFENGVTYESIFDDYYRIAADAQVRRTIDRTAVTLYVS